MRMLDSQKAIEHLEAALARFRWAAEHEPIYWTGDRRHKTPRPDPEEWAENQRHMKAAQDEIQTALKILQAPERICQAVNSQ